MNRLSTLVTLLIPLLAVARPATPAQAEVPVPPGTARRLLEATAGLLKDSYVFPERAPELETKLRQLGQSRDYSPQRTPAALAEQLSRDIQEVSHDRHLRIIYRADEHAESPDPGADRAREEAENFGFRRVELLDGNVAYLDVRFFAAPSDAGETVVAAMGFVAHARALIIDLRNNHGGDPGTVLLLASYLLGDSPVHLNDIYWRPDNSTGQFWTQGFVPGRRFKGDVFVLIGPDTFSAGEELAYDLKTQHRATLIGTATGGGAHPITMHPLDAHFTALIPSGRAINPVTHTDWEGVGVQPDVVVPADQALEKAQALALATHRAP